MKQIWFTDIYTIGKREFDVTIEVTVDIDGDDRSVDSIEIVDIDGNQYAARLTEWRESVIKKYIYDTYQNDLLNCDQLTDAMAGY